MINARARMSLTQTCDGASILAQGARLRVRGNVMRRRAVGVMAVVGVVGVCVAGALPAVAQTPASSESDADAARAAQPAAPQVRPEAKKRHNEALASFRAG